MDFVSDQLANGQRFRALTVVDVFTREALAIEVGSRLRAEHVVAFCSRLACTHRPPGCVFLDYGSEFTGRLMDLWAYHQKVKLDFSRPGKPTEPARRLVLRRAGGEVGAVDERRLPGGQGLHDAVRRPLVMQLQQLCLLLAERSGHCGLVVADTDGRARVLLELDRPVGAVDLVAPRELRQVDGERGQVRVLLSSEDEEMSRQ